MERARGGGGGEESASSPVWFRGQIHHRFKAGRDRSLKKASGLKLECYRVLEKIGGFTERSEASITRMNAKRWARGERSR